MDTTTIPNGYDVRQLVRCTTFADVYGVQQSWRPSSTMYNGQHLRMKVIKVIQQVSPHLLYLSFCTSLFRTSLSVPLFFEPLFLYLFLYRSFCTSLLCTSLSVPLCTCLSIPFFLYFSFCTSLLLLLFCYFSFVTSLFLLLFFYFSFPNQVGNGFTEIINAGGITEQTTNFTFNLGMDDQCGIWYSNINKCKA